MTFRYQLISLLLYIFISVYASFSSVFCIHLTDFPFLSFCPPTLLSTIPTISSCAPPLSPDSWESIPLSFLSSLFTPPLPLFRPLSGTHLCCIRQDMPREKGRGRIERRKTWKMDSVWALHYNGELSQGFKTTHLSAFIHPAVCPLWTSCLYFALLWECNPLLWCTVKYL